MNKVIIVKGGELVSLSLGEVLNFPISYFANIVNQGDLREIIGAIFVDKRSTDYIVSMAIMKYPQMKVSDLIRETFVNEDYTITMFGKQYMMFCIEDIMAESTNPTSRYMHIKDVLTYDLKDDVSKYINLGKFFSSEWLLPMQNGKAASNSYAKLTYAFKEDEYTFYCLEIKQ